MSTEAVAAGQLEPIDGERSVRSYFASFAPAPDWDDLGRGPDVFALANLVLDHTESYRFVVAPPPGRRWPPVPDWNAEIRREAREWREACGTPGGEPPPLVRDSWRVVTRSRDVSLAGSEAALRGNLSPHW